jgi:hypothetical protein
LHRYCARENAEFQYFIRFRDIAGTKSDHASGHHCKNATAIHDFSLPVLITVSPREQLPSQATSASAD